MASSVEMPKFPNSHSNRHLSWRQLKFTSFLPFASASYSTKEKGKHCIIHLLLWRAMGVLLALGYFYSSITDVFANQHFYQQTTCVWQTSTMEISPAWMEISILTSTPYQQSLRLFFRSSRAPGISLQVISTHDASLWIWVYFSMSIFVSHFSRSSLLHSCHTSFSYFAFFLSFLSSLVKSFTVSQISFYSYSTLTPEQLFFTPCGLCT